MKKIKIHRQFALYALFSQTFIFACHYVLFIALTAYFPFLALYGIELALVLFLLAIGFLFFNLLDHLMENPLVRAGYIVSAIWMPAWLYLLIASFFTAIINLIFKIQNPLLPYFLFSIAIALVAYGIVNARLVKITEIKVKLPNLPSFWKNKTAVMLSDLHFGHVLKKPTARKLVNLVNSLNPEIVFIPGDFYDGPKTDFVGLAMIFKNLTAPSGTYFCSGNHEAIAGMETCNLALAQAGIVLLEDKKVNVNGLQILGTAYVEGETEENLKNILQSLNIDREKPSIYLKHVPNNLKAPAEAGVSIQLSGHTHLGQMWPFHYITKKVFKGYDYGLKQLRSMKIFTSSGVGTWGPPVRVFTPAEIVKITFE